MSARKMMSATVDTGRRPISAKNSASSKGASRGILS